MNLSDHQLREYLGACQNVRYDERHLQETIRRAKNVFYENEGKEMLSHAEFLYQQSRYIHKRWWILQGILLLMLWIMLILIDSGFYIQRFMGIAASLFAVLLLPELWKNRSSGALEIESTAYYSLRQIYSARMFLFALVDMFFLSIFSLAVVWTGKIPMEEMVIHFFLPFIVSCCICFHILYSSRSGSESLAIILCMVWCTVWTQLILSEKIYEAISLPVWFLMTAAAVLYLGYCIYRGQRSCREMWEVNSPWN